MKQLEELRLVFPIGGKEYVAPPVGIDAGWELTEILALDEDAAAKSQASAEHLFQLALSPELWEQMKSDRVSLTLSFRAGMAALAAFRVQTFGGSNEDAQIAADGIWESGLNPEALAAWATAKAAQDASTTSPATPPRARKSSTKPRANTPRTNSRQGTKPRVSRSAGPSSLPAKT